MDEARKSEASQKMNTTDYFNKVWSYIQKWWVKKYLKKFLFLLKSDELKSIWKKISFDW